MAMKHNEQVTVRLPRWVAEQLSRLASAEAVRMGHAMKRLQSCKVPGQHVLIKAAEAAVETMHGAVWSLYNGEVEKCDKPTSPF